MTTDQFMQILYLGLLVAAIGGSYLFANRANIGKMAQQGAIWGFIFLGTIGAYGLWGDISRDVTRQHRIDGEAIIIPRSADGHYHITLYVNQTPVRFVVDTGATMMVLSQDDARRVGFAPEELAYLGTASTANGVVRTADVRLAEVAIGPHRDANVPATVNGGPMRGSLLGMSYLSLYGSMHFTDGQLILTR